RGFTSGCRGNWKRRSGAGGRRRSARTPACRVETLLDAPSARMTRTPCQRAEQVSRESRLDWVGRGRDEGLRALWPVGHCQEFGGTQVKISAWKCWKGREICLTVRAYPGYSSPYATGACRLEVWYAGEMFEQVIDCSAAGSARFFAVRQWQRPRHGQ